MSEMTDFLRSSSLFSTLRQEDLEQLSLRFRAREFSAGEHIVREGSDSDEFFLIRRGNAKVTRGQTGDEVILTSLSASDSFGEAALFQDAKRSANIVALDLVETMCISRADFESFLEAHPMPAKRVLHQMLRELFFRLEKTNAQLEFERQGGFAHNALRQLLS